MEANQSGGGIGTNQPSWLTTSLMTCVGQKYSPSMQYFLQQIVAQSSVLTTTERERHFITTKNEPLYIHTYMKTTRTTRHSKKARNRPEKHDHSHSHTHTHKVRTSALAASASRLAASPDDNACPTRSSASRSAECTSSPEALRVSLEKGKKHPEMIHYCLHAWYIYEVYVHAHAGRAQQPAHQSRDVVDATRGFKAPG